MFGEQTDRHSVAAVAAKVTKRLWEIGDIVDVLEAWEMAHHGEVS
jgi:hypothetical protein